MKERPILFNGEMVRAILDGRKTQTRRPIKPQPKEIKNGWWEWGYAYGASKATAPRLCSWHAETWQRESGTAPIDRYCPSGIPGDQLWVRETWGVHRLTGSAGDKMYLEYPNVLYRADSSTMLVIDDEVWKYVDGKFRWRPSIHMPRWASRITLEVTDVRVERLQEITDDDARSEGAVNDDWDEWYDNVRNYAIPGSRIERPRDVFHYLWDSIYSKRGFGWDTNPWVWVVEFAISEDRR